MAAHSPAGDVRFCRPRQPSAGRLFSRIGTVCCLATWAAEDDTVLLAADGSDGTAYPRLQYLPPGLGDR